MKKGNFFIILLIMVISMTACAPDFSVADDTKNYNYDLEKIYKNDLLSSILNGEIIPVKIIYGDMQYILEGMYDYLSPPAYSPQLMSNTVLIGSTNESSYCTIHCGVICIFPFLSKLSIVSPLLIGKSLSN